MRRPAARAGHPKNRILCEFAGDADAWQARVGGYPDIMRNFKDVRAKTHFETQNQDWVADLMKFKRYELSLKQGDPSGSGSGSRGAQLVEAATGTGMARKTGGIPGVMQRSTRNSTSASDPAQSDINEWFAPSDSPAAPGRAAASRQGPSRNTRNSGGAGTSSASDVNGRPARERHKTVLIYPNESSKDAVTLTNEDMERLTTQVLLPPPPPPHHTHTPAAPSGCFCPSL